MAEGRAGVPHRSRLPEPAIRQALTDGKVLPRYPWFAPTTTGNLEGFLEVCATDCTPLRALPATDCTPNPSSGCPAQRVCYLVDTNPAGDRTICDISAGQGKQNMSCRYARDCFPGYTCATTGPGVGRCWPVCTLPGGSCPGVLTCQDVGKAYGYCD